MIKHDVGRASNDGPSQTPISSPLFGAGDREEVLGQEMQNQAWFHGVLLIQT